MDKISGYVAVSNDISDLLHPHLFVRAHDRFRSVEIRQPDMIWDFYLQSIEAGDPGWLKCSDHEYSKGYICLVGAVYPWPTNHAYRRDLAEKHSIRSMLSRSL